MIVHSAVGTDSRFLTLAEVFEEGFKSDLVSPFGEDENGIFHALTVATTYKCYSIFTSPPQVQKDFSFLDVKNNSESICLLCLGGAHFNAMRFDTWINKFKTILARIRMSSIANFENKTLSDYAAFEATQLIQSSPHEDLKVWLQDILDRKIIMSSEDQNAFEKKLLETLVNEFFSESDFGKGVLTDSPLKESFDVWVSEEKVKLLNSKSFVLWVPPGNIPVKNLETAALVSLYALKRNNIFHLPLGAFHRARQQSNPTGRFSQREQFIIFDERVPDEILENLTSLYFTFKEDNNFSLKEIYEISLTV